MYCLEGFCEGIILKRWTPSIMLGGNRKHNHCIQWRWVALNHWILTASWTGTGRCHGVHWAGLLRCYVTVIAVIMSPWSWSPLSFIAHGMNMFSQSMLSCVACAGDGELLQWQYPQHWEPVIGTESRDLLPSAATWQVSGETRLAGNYWFPSLDRADKMTQHCS